MTDKKKPDALHLADELLDCIDGPAFHVPHYLARQSAAELRRLHAENTTLQQGYAAARLEIESLRARGAAPAGEYPALPTRYYLVGGERKAWDEADMRAYVDADRAMRAAQPVGAQQSQLTELQKDATELLFALQEAWPYVHVNCTIKQRKEKILTLLRKHGEFADRWEQEKAPAQAAGEANWAQLRSALAMLMLGWGRNPNQNMEACNTVLDSATEPGMPLALLRSAPDWRTHVLRASHGQAPAGAAPVNPHWDYLKRYWQMGFDGVSLDACTGDAPIKAWHEGKAARESMTAPTAQPAPAATPQADSQPAPAAVAGPVVNRATVIEWLDANDIEVTDRQMDGLFHSAAPTTQPAQVAQLTSEQRLAMVAEMDAHDIVLAAIDAEAAAAQPAPQQEPIKKGGEA